MTVLTAGLVLGEVDVERLARTYRAGFRLRSSARERGSVIEHLEDLVELVLPNHPLHEGLTSVLDGLRRAFDVVAADLAGGPLNP